MEMKKFKNQKGVTLISLAFTIVIILILTSMIVYNIPDYVHTKKLKDLQNDLQIIGDKVKNYYAKNNSIPGVVEYSWDNDTEKTYYIVDLQSLGGLTLNYGHAGYELYKNYRSDILNGTLTDAQKNELNSEKDVFIMNAITLNVYYAKGLEYDEITYYSFNKPTDDSTITPPVEETKYLAKKANIGDYVNYDPTSGVNATPEKTKYTSVAGSTTEHGNGYGSQTFTAANYKKKWRILDKDESSGTVTLISDPIYRDNNDGTAMLTASNSNGLRLKDGIGYIWAEEELHRIAAIYGHGYGADTSKTITYYYGGPNDKDPNATGEYVLTGAEAQQGIKSILKVDGSTDILYSGARALTIEDINKICGKDTTYTANYSQNPIKKTKENATFIPTLYAPEDKKTTGQSVAQTTVDGYYYWTYYSYTISSAYSDGNKKDSQNDMLKPKNTSYLLASRCVGGGEFNIIYSVRVVSSNGSISNNYTCVCQDNTWSPGTSSNAVRVIVTLQSGIKTNDTEYNATTGWNLAD